ncbi:MAG: carboxymuconolactone decarboxylase family protein [Acidobacteria bacterium]|nr:carboxymuconolactone decarboxylase family protein [Acidobacteriota bacterium]
MLQSRIEPLAPPYEAEVGEMLQKLMPPGMEPLKLFRTVAHNPEVLKNFVANGRLIYQKSSLDMADRELVIQRTCARCRAEYEWGVHAKLFGERAGLQGDKLQATMHANAAAAIWSDRERLLVQLVDELHERAQVSDELWQSLLTMWTKSQLIEIIVLVGFYHTVSFLTNAVQVDLEDFAARF